MSAPVDQQNMSPYTRVSRPSSAALNYAPTATAQPSTPAQSYSHQEPNVFPLTDPVVERSRSVSPLEMMHSPQVDTAQYTYEVTPNVNKLQRDYYPSEVSRPVGPVARVKSAPGEYYVFKL